MSWRDLPGFFAEVPGQAAHVKSGVAGTIPLSAAAIALLDSIRSVEITRGSVTRLLWVWN